MSLLQKYTLGITLLVLGVMGVYFYETKEISPKIVDSKKEPLNCVIDENTKKTHKEVSKVTSVFMNKQDIVVVVPSNIHTKNTIKEDTILSINTLIQYISTDSTYNYKAINKSKQKILAVAKNNPLALEELLIAYSNNLSIPKLEKQLSQIVSQIKDPKVENFAQNLATSEDRQKNIIGFDLLGELQIPNEKTLQIATEALSQFSGDKELTLSALHAMPHLNLPQSKNNEIVMLLSELSISQDEAVRSESIITLGQWAKSELEISAVVDALSSSTNDDRISAAIALEQSHVVGNSLKTVLLEKLEDTTELWEVRAMSANSLERFDLNNNEFSILENFRKNQVGGVKN